MVTFFDNNKDFVPPIQWVNIKYYVQELSRLVQTILSVRPLLQERWNWFFLHGNCSINKAVFVKARNSIIKSPLILLLSPLGFFLFVRIKSMLEGRCFEDVKGIQRSVIKELLALYANEFKILFPSLL
jgi:hypothetical protein